MATEGLGFGLEITELRLGLPGSSGNEKKRVFSEIVGENRQGGGTEDGEKAPVAKSQVVGWPPVRAYRMKSFDKDRMKNICSVKVSMDGAICLRKIDLAMQKGYNGLVVALEKLFGCYGIGEGLKESSESGEYKLIYEDKDGDWMLVGDVPWEMFTETCKRLRIMKKSEAKEIGGLLKERDFLKSGASFGDNHD